MVAIVSGNSLGLSLSSLATLGQGGTDGNGVVGRSTEQAYVNVATGNLVLQTQDDFVASTGDDVASIRTYNSRGAPLWLVGAQQKITVPYEWGVDSLTRVDRDAAAVTYNWDQINGRYFTTTGGGAYDTVQFAGGTYKWTDGATGLVELYNGNGRLVSSTDADGNVITYTHDTAGRLTQVLDAAGEVVTYNYDGAGRLTSIDTALNDGPLTRRVEYGYDDCNRLTRVSVDLTPEDQGDDNVFYTDYTYLPDTYDEFNNAIHSNLVATVQKSDGTSLMFKYDTSGRVSAVHDGLLHVTSYFYGNGTTTVIDPVGAATVYTYDSQGQLKSVQTGSVAPGAATTTTLEAVVAKEITVYTVTEPDGTDYFAWDQPAPGTQVTWRYRPVGEPDSAWVALTPQSWDDGTQRVAAPVATLGDFEYELLETPLDASFAAAQAKGTFSTQVSVPGHYETRLFNVDKVEITIERGAIDGQSSMSWAQPEDDVSTVWRYRPAQDPSADWQELAVVATDGRESVDLSAIAPGSYSFELVQLTETDVPQAHATGVLTIEAAEPAHTVDHQVPAADPVAGLSASGQPQLTWDAPSVGIATTAKVRLSGGQWIDLAVANDTTMGRQVLSLAGLSAGTYEYDITSTGTGTQHTQGFVEVLPQVTTTATKQVPVTVLAVTNNNGGLSWPEPSSGAISVFRYRVPGSGEAGWQTYTGTVSYASGNKTIDKSKLALNSWTEFEIVQSPAAGGDPTAHAIGYYFYTGGGSSNLTFKLGQVGAVEGGGYEVIGATPTTRSVSYTTPAAYGAPRLWSTQVTVGTNASGQAQLTADIPPAGTTASWSYKNSSGAWQALTAATDATTLRQIVSLAGLPAGAYDYRMVLAGGNAATVSGRVEIPPSNAHTETQQIAVSQIAVAVVNGGLAWTKGVGATTVFRYRVPGSGDAGWITYTGSFTYTTTQKTIASANLPHTSSSGWFEFEIVQTPAGGLPTAHATGLYSFPDGGAKASDPVIQTGQVGRREDGAYVIIGTTPTTRAVSVNAASTAQAREAAATQVAAETTAAGVSQLTWDLPPAGTATTFRYMDAAGAWQSFAVSTDAARDKQFVSLVGVAPGRYGYEIAQSGATTATLTGAVDVLAPIPANTATQTVSYPVLTITISGSSFAWPAGTEGSTTSLRYRLVGTTQWSTFTGPFTYTGTNGTLRQVSKADLPGAQGDQMEFEVLATSPTGEPLGHATGLFQKTSLGLSVDVGQVGPSYDDHGNFKKYAITGPTVNTRVAQITTPAIPLAPRLVTTTVTASLDSRDVEQLSWDAPPFGTTSTWKYKDANGQWQTVPVVQDSAARREGVFLDALPAGTYEYQLEQVGSCPALMTGQVVVMPSVPPDGDFEVPVDVIPVSIVTLHDPITLVDTDYFAWQQAPDGFVDELRFRRPIGQEDWDTVNQNKIFNLDGLTMVAAGPLRGREYEVVRFPLGDATPVAHSTGLIDKQAGTMVVQTGVVGRDASGNVAIVAPVAATHAMHRQAPTHTETVQVQVDIIPLTRTTVNGVEYVAWPELTDGSVTVLRVRDPKREERVDGKQRNSKSSVWKTIKDRDFIYLNGMKMVKLRDLNGKVFDLQRIPAGGGFATAQSTGMVTRYRREYTLEVGQIGKDENGRTAVLNGVPNTRTETIIVRDGVKPPRLWSSTVSIEQDASGVVRLSWDTPAQGLHSDFSWRDARGVWHHPEPMRDDTTGKTSVTLPSIAAGVYDYTVMFVGGTTVSSQVAGRMQIQAPVPVSTSTQQLPIAVIPVTISGDRFNWPAASGGNVSTFRYRVPGSGDQGWHVISPVPSQGDTKVITAEYLTNLGLVFRSTYEFEVLQGPPGGTPLAHATGLLSVRGTSTLNTSLGVPGQNPNQNHEEWVIVGATTTTQVVQVTSGGYTPAPVLKGATRFATEQEYIAVHTPTPRSAVTTKSSRLAKVWIDDKISVADAEQTPLGLVQANVTYYYGAPALQSLKTVRSFAYNGNGDVTDITDGTNHTTHFEYDSHGNQTLARDALGNTITRTFNSANALLTETVNGKTIHNVYDAGYPNRLRFTVSSEGRVTEYQYNATGLRTSKLVYTASQYAAADFSLTALAAWATPSTKAITRIDYAYDFRGEVSTETLFAKLDASGLGVDDGTESVTHYIYDSQGRLTDKYDSAGNIHYTYDGLDRVVTVTTRNSATATALDTQVNSYDDQGNRIVTTLRNGLASTAIYDLAGRLMTEVERDDHGLFLGSTRFTYDAANHLVMTTDATGVSSLSLYDKQGRKAADIDGNGSLTEYLYDNAGRLTRTIRYASSVSQSQLVDANGRPLLPDLATIRPASTPADRNTWRAYDAGGRLVKTVDADGAVTEYSYDAASRLVSSKQYATALTNTSALGNTPAPADIAPTANATQDRVTRNFYDADGLLRGTLDAEGYLTEMRYDAGGRLVQKIAYATLTAESFRDAGTLADLLPAGNDEGASTLYLFDVRGMQVGEIDAEGYLTEYARDGRGRVTRTTRYAKKVTAAYGPGCALDSVRPGDSAGAEVTTRAYDARDRLIEETNYEGTVTHYAYDPTTGALLETLTGYGTADSHALQVARYDEFGRLVAELTGEGYAKLATASSARAVEVIWHDYGITHTYDAAGRRTSTTDQYRNTTFFFYDADGHLTHTVDALGGVVEYVYDTLGNRTDEIRHATPISLTGLMGGLATQAFKDAVAALANAADSKTQFNYTASGRLKTSTDALGKVTSFTYDAFGELQSRSDPFGASSATTTTAYSYDRRGLQKSQTVDSGGLDLLTQYEYDAFGRLKTTTDANGQQFGTTYDKLGRLTSTQDALLAKRYTTYDAFGRVLTQKDALGHITKYEYDNAQRTVTMTSREGVVVTTTHDIDGHTVSVTDGRGNDTSYTYDLDGHLRTQDGAALHRELTYDRAGRLVEDEEGTSVVAISYDAAGRVFTRTVDPSGLKLTTTYTYDAQGRTITVKDPKNVVTQIEYDLAGHVWKQTVDPAGLNLVTQYSYDGTGRVLKVTSPSGGVTQYTYDKAGRRTSAQVVGLQSATKNTWYYDDNGNVTSVVDGNGNRTRYVYDANNRLAYTVDAQGDVQATTYDAKGRATKTTRYAKTIDAASLSNAPTMSAVANLLVLDATDAVQNFVYDKDDRVTDTVNGLGEVVHYTYDANGNVTERRAYATRLTNWTPGSAVSPTADAAHDQWVRTQYDTLNRAIYTIDAAGTVTTQQYDANGNVTLRRSYANAVANPAAFDGVTQLVPAASGTDVQERYVYDAAQRLTYSADSLGQVTRRIYDADGNLTQQVQYNNTVTPDADPETVTASAGKDRITNFVYDAAGRVTWQVDALGYATNYAYDANGNVTDTTRYSNKVAVPVFGSPVSSVTAPASDAAKDRTTRTAWDAANRLVYSIDPYGVVTEYVYDGLDHVTKTIVHANAISLASLPARSALASDVKPLVASASADHSTQQGFDKAGRLASTTDALGNVTTLDYDGAGRLLSTTEGARVTQSWYDGAGRVMKTQDATGSIELFDYDGVGNTKHYINARNAVWTYEYDTAGRMTREISPVIVLASLTQDASGNPIADTSQNARLRTYYEYDAQGRLLSRTEASRVEGQSADAAQTRVTTYDYDALGRQIRTHFAPVSVYTDESDAQLLANGAAGNATRTDGAAQSLYTETRYDSFGNATAGRDLAGNWSYKAYDLAGRLAYDVDQMGYVTGYDRNAFGDVVTLTRYSNNINITNRNGATMRPGDVSVTTKATEDRALTTTYDLNGHAIQVTEPAAYTYDADTGTYATVAAVTKNTYDVFGNLVKVQRQKNATDWLTEVRYYDDAGRLTATVDAAGYLTKMTYDRWGNLTVRTDYNDPIPAWNPDTAAASAPSGNANASYDRKTGWTYDELNRKKSETLYGVQYAESTDTAFSSGSADLTTTYGYDAVGNLVSTTDAAGGVTYNYYDTLGRLTAMVGPAVNGGVASLTEFRRDAFGNAVAQIAYYNGATALSANGYTVTADSTKDRVTHTSFDAAGHALQIVDATGVSHYASYDALGHVAKEWQTVSAAGVPAQTWFRQHHYDKLGHKTEMKDPSSVNFVQTAAGVVTTTMQYNAFGEITSRGVSGSTEHEYWEYDLAGRAWHTNEGGGVDKVYLYDRLGRRTSVLQSGGSGSGDKDVSTFTSASAAVANNTLRRTDYKYDALGHVVQEVQAARSESFSDVSVRNTTVGASVPEHGRYVIVTDNGQNSQTQWIPATISLSWPDLSALGDGALKIDVQYSEQQYAYDEGNAVVTESAEVQTSQFFRESSEAATGTTLTIVNPYTNDNPIGGVGSVKHVTISKLDAGGNWVTIADQAVPASTGNVIDVEKVEGFVSQDIQVLDKQTAGAAWTTIPKSLWLDFGAKYMVDLRSYDASRYQYRLVGTMPGGLQTVLFASDLSNTTSTYNGTTQTLRPTINYTVDRWGGVTSESDARNANWVTTYRYDKRGLIYQVITPDASGTGVFTSSVVHHDRLGRQVAVQDGNLHVNRQVLDGNGQVLEEVHADGGKVYNSYNGFGERTSTVDAVGNLTRFAYDKQGNLTDTDRYGYRNADGTTNGFAVYGVVRSGVDLELTSNTPTHQGYLREHNDWDTAGRLLAKTNAAGQTTRYRYDLRGNVVQTTKADGATNTYDAYDSRNRKVAEKDPNANTATWTYDALGQLASHTDIGGHTYTYGHDHARQLTAKTGGGQNVGYSYDAAGQLMRVIDNSAGGDGAALNKITTYQYDLAGHTIAERLTQGGEVYQDNYMAYDALGRLAWTGDTRANAIFTYDNAGNRTRAQTHEVNYDTTGGQANTNNSDRYYQYDAMNRQTLVDGDAAGNIGAKGHRLAYDKAGNRVSDTFVGKKVTTTTGSIINYDEGGGANYGGEVTYFTVQDGAEVTEAYKYDGAGHLISIERDGLQIDWRLYDAAGRAVQTGSNAQIDSTYYNLLYGNTTGNGSSIIRNQYDVNGQLKMQESWNSTATQKNQTIFFEKSNGTSGYDAAGNLTDYKVVVGFAQETISYSSTLELREGYLQKTTTAVSSKTGTGTSTNSYDANGAMASFTDAVKHENDKTFVANESGQVIATTQGTNVLRQMTVNGEVLGQYGGTLDKQNVANFQFGYRSVTPSYPNASPGTYVIQAGDTLRTIAQSAYGDANLWFEVADANSLRSDADLRVGQTLIVPSNIGGAHNDVSTFTPYDPSTIVGDTSPTLPMPQGHHGGCGGVGQILAIVIAVVATVLTAGAAAVALAAEGSALAGMGAMEAGLAIATGEAIGGLTAGVAMGAGAIGGAVGSIAGQVTSIATGNQHGFSWKQVGLSALGGGISAGVANELGASGALAGKSAPMAAARAAVANAATQGVAVATGQQHSFNWKATAASAVGAAVGQTIAPSLANAFGNTAAGQFAAQMTTRIVARSAGAAVSGDKVVLRQIAVDAFGNALGQGLVDSSRPTDNTQLPTGEFGRMDGEGSRSAPYDGGSAWSADVAARAQARRVQLEQYSADSPAYVGDSPAPNLPQAPVLVTLSPKQLQQMSQPQPAGALPEWDTQTVLVPGSYGGQIDSVEVLRGPSWLDAAHTRLDLGKLQITSRWGFLERADDFLERLQEPFAKYVTDRQDEGADAYARGDYWTAAKRAVGYLPDKVISDVAQGAIGTVRLATNNSMLPNLVRAVGSPLQTAQAMYNGFANMPLQDKVVTGLEVVGPMALKMTSPMAARAFGGTAVREFGSGGTLYTYGDHLKPVLGPATLSHPDELASILTRARDMGVGVRYEPGRLAYEPALRSGNPGTLILDPDASIGAVRHEWRHALDDAQLGHPGFGLMADSEAFWRLEYRGYMEEISLARQTRNFDVGRQIVDEMRARRSEILGY